MTRATAAAEMPADQSGVRHGAGRRVPGDGAHAHGGGGGRHRAAVMARADHLMDLPMRQLEEVGRGAHLIAGQAVGAQHRIGERHREGRIVGSLPPPAPIWCRIPPPEPTIAAGPARARARSPSAPGAPAWSSGSSRGPARGSPRPRPRAARVSCIPSPALPFVRW